MIGRGTRLLEPKKMKSWCLEKDKFLIMDCWENFEYFQMNPQGKTGKRFKANTCETIPSKVAEIKCCR